MGRRTHKLAGGTIKVHMDGGASRAAFAMESASSLHGSLRWAYTCSKSNRTCFSRIARSVDVMAARMGWGSGLAHSLGSLGRNFAVVPDADPLDGIQTVVFQSE